MNPGPAQPFRSAGRWAFDWCVVPLGIHVMLLVPFFIILQEFGLRRTLRIFFPPLRAVSDFLRPVYPAYIVFCVVGVLLAAHWVWGLRAVILTWRDPLAKFWRLASVLLLLFYLPLILSLLRLPFVSLR